MEILGQNGSKTPLAEGDHIDFGRGLGFNSDDRTVSRRHISFQLHKSNHKDATKVSFVVKGKNPIWICNSDSGEISVYRKSERGEVETGDLFCISAKNPVWFNLRTIENESRGNQFDDELAESLQTGHGLPGNEHMEIEAGDLANIDPIKEFGFVVLGHEFDGYPKKMMRNSKNWDWFLEEDREKSDSDDNDDRTRKKGTTRKRKKKGGGNEEDDDEWAGESEEDTELITKLSKVQKPKYSTRSKDKNKGASIGKKSRQMDATSSKEIDEDEEEEDEDDDEADETLGGFIIDDEGAEEEKEIDEDEDEEEEEDFDEDEDEEE